MSRLFLLVQMLLMAGLVSLGCEDPARGTSVSSEDGDTETQEDPDTSGGNPDTDTCANLDLSLERQPTTIILVIDHSASMDLQLGDNDTRWSVLVSALMGTAAQPEQGLVWELQDQVNFGMVLYTAVRNEPENCPLIEAVAPALHNAAAIGAIFKADDETYKGASPVPEGILAATQVLNEMDDLSRKVILLAFDGMPQTCDTLAVADDPVGRSETIEAVQAAYGEGIATFVVGVGDADAATHLQQVANAGTGLVPDGGETAIYYQGATENSLVDAISEVVVEESRSCIYELEGKGVAPGEEERGTVSLDGEALTYEDAENGWRLKSPGEIELLGEACETIQMGDHHLEADFPCEAIIIIE